MTCQLCGGAFESHWMGRPRKFCSANCKSRAANWRTRTGLAVADLRLLLESRRCRWCGGVIRWGAGYDVLYCCRRCKNRGQHMTA